MNNALGLRGVKVSYRDYNLSLLAGQPREINVGGNYWQIISQSVSADLLLEFDEVDRITRRAGSGGPSQYQRVRITSAVDQSVVISLGYTGGGNPYDRSPVTIGGTINVADAVPSSNATIADAVVTAGAQAIVVAANANRRTALIKLVTDVPLGVRIGDSATAAARGYQMDTGDTASIDGTAAIYVFNPNAVSVTLAVTFQTIP